MAEVEMPTDEEILAVAKQMAAGKRSKPAWNADDVRFKLRGYDRTPFLDVLQHWLENGPSVGDVEALAKKSPDKWASAVTQLARIAGFTEKTESTINHNISVTHMSDSQLEDEIKQRVAAMQGVIDVPYREITAPAPLGDGEPHSQAVSEMLARQNVSQEGDSTQ
jgi:hypothetical protein